MRILVIGASGRTGQLVTRMAVSRSHTITALVRSDMTFSKDGAIKTIVGNPTVPDDVAKALLNQDVVVSCLGQRSKSDASLLRTAASAMVQAMRSGKVRRYIVVSQGLLFPSRNPVIALLRMILARHVADSIAMEQLVQASGVEWTIVRPPRLQEGGKPRGYRVRVDSQPVGRWSMQRVDLAAYLLDEAERGEHVRTIVGVTSG